MNSLDAALVESIGIGRPAITVQSVVANLIENEARIEYLLFQGFQGTVTMHVTNVTETPSVEFRAYHTDRSPDEPASCWQSFTDALEAIGVPYNRKSLN